MVEQVLPGKGLLRQGVQLGRGRYGRGGLERKQVAGEIDCLCQEHAAWAYRPEVRVAVRLGYPRPGRLGEVTCILSKPCRRQQRPLIMIRGSSVKIIFIN